MSAESAHQKELSQFLERSPAGGTNAAFEVTEPSARPAGNSPIKLHQFPVRPEGGVHDLVL
jgi:hypothetical protein